MLAVLLFRRAVSIQKRKCSVAAIKLTDTAVAILTGRHPWLSGDRRCQCDIILGIFDLGRVNFILGSFGSIGEPLRMKFSNATSPIVFR